jgi:pimeloyl-ACP methyl ester carboxylesterase
MPQITVGHENSAPIHLYYEDHGTGRPIVLIHGWPLSGASWEKQRRALLTWGYRVIAYDRRGFGMSSQPSVGYNYETLADDLNLLMDYLDLHEATLMGFSMGAGEGARYLGKFGSARVSQAVFISGITPCLLKSPENPTGVDGSVFKKIQADLVADRPGFLKGFFQDFYNVDTLSGKRISDPVVQASWLSAVLASPKGTLDCVEAWLTDFRPDIKRILVPTLVLHGDADRIVPIASTAKVLAKIFPAAEYVTLEGAPHGVLWTHADEVNAELEKFLR